MRAFLNIFAALFLLFSVITAVNILGKVNRISENIYSSDPKVKTANVTFETEPLSENLQNEAVLAYSDEIVPESAEVLESEFEESLKRFLTWRDTAPATISKAEILPDTYFEEDAQFQKRLNVSEDGLIEGSLAIGGSLRVDDESTFEGKVTIDDENLEINGVNYYFPDDQAESNGYVLSNDGSGNLTWSDVNDFTTGVSSLTGTANQISVSSPTGDITLSIPSTFILPGTLEVTSNSTFNGSSTFNDAAVFNNSTTFEGSVTFNDPINLGSISTVADNNQVLTNNGGTVAAIDTTNWDKDVSDDFSGISGTDNRVARFNATGDNVEDGSITDDYSGISVAIDSSGQVGIGTTAPTQQLDVVGGIRTTDDFYVGAIGLNDNASLSSGSSLIGVFDDAMTNVSSNTTVQSAIKQLDTAIVAAAASGVTSIAGTANQITASAATGAVTLSLPTTLIAPGSVQSLGNMTFGDASGDTVTSNAASWTFANDTNFALSGGTNGLSFDTDTLSIDAANNRVGIGTTAPSSKLDLAGNLLVNSDNPAFPGTASIQSFSDVGSTPGMILYDNRALAAGTGGKISFGSKYTTSGNNYYVGASIWSDRDLATAGQYGTSLAFSTRTHGSAEAERMRITSTGNVGIGTTNAFSKLAVVGTSAAAGGVQAAINNTTATGYSALRLGQDGQQSTGGTLHHFNSSYSGSGAYLANTTNLAGLSSGGLTLSADHASGVMRFFTGGGAASNERMTITAAGNVGIGTSAPGTRLDVSGGSIRTTAQLMSTVATGTAPLAVSSTTLVSNLNADMTDGYDVAEASTVSTIAARNASGDINARLFRSEYDTTNSSIGFIMTQVNTGADNYIRPSTPAQLVTALGLEAGGSRDVWVEKAGDTMTGDLTHNGGNGIESRRGMHGGYNASSPGSTNWGASIWSIGSSWNGSGYGTTFVPGSYGLAWLRAGHPDSITLAGEGLYIYRNGTLSSAIGVDGAYFVSEVQAGSFAGSGASLTSLNASQLTSGTVPDARITGSYTGLTNLTGSGTATFGAFSGSGSSLTSLNASQLTSGTVPDARISGSYTGLVSLTGSGNAVFTRHYGSTGATAASPAFSFTGATDMGMYYEATDRLSFSTLGVRRLSISSIGEVSISNLPSLSVNDVVVESANVLGSRAIDSRVWGSSLIDVSGTPTASAGARWVDGNTLAASSIITDNSNAIGINDTTPTEGEFVVQGGGAQAIYGATSGSLNSGVQGINNSSGGYGVEGSSNAGYGVYGLSASTGRGVVSNNTAGGSSLYCFTSSATGCAGDEAWFNASDRKLKKNIEPISDALQKLLNLEGVTYVMKKDKTESRNMGFIAQDVLPYAPEVVRFDELENQYGMQTSQLTALIVEAVKEQQAQIENLAVNAEGDITLFGQVVQVQQAQAEQANSIIALTSRLTDVEALIASLTVKIDSLTNRLNKFDEIMAWTEGVGDSIASVIFKVPTVFSEMAFFEAPIKVNADTSETIEIPEGTLKAKITFTKSFPDEPSIYLSFVDSVPVEHEITDISEDGFTISFTEATESKFKVQWLAILRDKSKEGPSVEIIGENSDGEEETTIAEESDEEQTDEEPVEEIVEAEEPEVLGIEEEIVASEDFGISEGAIASVDSSNTDDFGIELGGVAVIKAGELSVTIESEGLIASSTIDAQSESGALIKVTKLGDGKFEVALDQVSVQDESVSWTITN